MSELEIKEDITIFITGKLNNHPMVYRSHHILQFVTLMHCHTEVKGNRNIKEKGLDESDKKNRWYGKE